MLHEFLDFVHDINIDFLKKDLKLSAKVKLKDLMEKKLFLLMDQENMQ